MSTRAPPTPCSVTHPPTERISGRPPPHALQSPVIPRLRGHLPAHVNIASGRSFRARALASWLGNNVICENIVLNLDNNKVGPFIDVQGVRGMLSPSTTLRLSGQLPDVVYRLGATQTPSSNQLPIEPFPKQPTSSPCLPTPCQDTSNTCL